MPVELIRIENFKSIKNLKLDCRKVNLFIGEPNTGKSNILEAFGLLSHVVYGNIRAFVRFEVMTDLFYDRVVDKPIIIGFDEKNLTVVFKDGRFAGLYKLPQQAVTEREVIFDYDYRGGTAQVHHGDFGIFKFYRFTKLAQFTDQRSEFLRPPNGSNLLAVVMSRKRLKEILNEVFGRFGYRPVFRPQEGKIEVLKELLDVIYSIPYSLASETLQRMVFYLAAIQSNSNSILTFEEPEAHAFPYYTKYLAERIVLDENNNQYFITTHNPYFLLSVLEKSPKEEVAVFATSLINYQTETKPLTDKQKEEILELGPDVFFNVKRFLD